MLKDKNFILSIVITISFIVLSIIYYIDCNKYYSIDSFTYKASHYFKNENYLQAIRYYKKLILMGAKDNKIYTNIAISLIRIGYYNLAINHLLDMEKKLFPTSEIYYLLAYSYYSQIKINKGTDFKIPIKYLEQSFELDNRNKNIYKLLGIIYEESNKFEHARKWYRKALFEDIDNSCEFYGLIANTYFKEDRFNEAIKYYKKAIDSNKNNIAAYCNLAKIYTIQNKFDISEKYYKKAIKVNHNYIFPYYQIGNLYFYQGKYNDAILWYSKALNIEPKEAIVNYYIGITYKKLNMLKEAIKHLKLAAYCGNDEAVKELRTMLETF